MVKDKLKAQREQQIRRNRISNESKQAIAKAVENDEMDRAIALLFEILTGNEMTKYSGDT